MHERFEAITRTRSRLIRDTSVNGAYTRTEVVIRQRSDVPNGVAMMGSETPIDCYALIKSRDPRHVARVLHGFCPEAVEIVRDYPVPRFSVPRAIPSPP